MIEYGCVRCQKWHAEADGPIYREHYYFQSKHGTRHLSDRDWALARLAQPDKQPGNYVDTVLRLRGPR